MVLSVFMNVRFRVGNMYVKKKQGLKLFLKKEENKLRIDSGSVQLGVRDFGNGFHCIGGDFLFWYDYQRGWGIHGANPI